MPVQGTVKTILTLGAGDDLGTVALTRGAGDDLRTKAEGNNSQVISSTVGQ
jgi:hypothetical protein